LTGFVAAWFSQFDKGISRGGPTMFCSHCGAQTPSEAKFCASCGKVIGTAQASETPPAAAPAAAPPAYTPSPAAGPVAAAAPAGQGGFMGWLRGLKTWKKVVLGIFIFIVLVIWLAMWATSGLVEPVERHFTALRSGDVVAAYAELSVAARQQTSLEDFKKMLEGTPALTHVTGESFSTRNTENGQGRLEGVLELEGGGKLPIQIRLVKENDAWKILAYKTSASEKTE
jgi:hypothetical protein